MNCLDPPTFTTTSTDLAAFLLCLDSEFLGAKRQPDGKVAFHFPDKCQELVAGYFNGQKVSAVRFFSELKRLKSLLHSSSIENLKSVSESIT